MSCINYQNVLLAGCLTPLFFNGCKTNEQKPVNQKITNLEEKPNIVFLLTDDQRWDALGYAGNDIIHTPGMDKLAAEGVYFPNAFVTTPICAASRASILSGMYERTHGMTFNTPPLSKKYVDISYPQLLKEAGYYNGFIGKFGMWLENKLDTGLFDVYDPYGTGFYWRQRGKGHVHLTDLTGEKAVDFIKDAPGDRPFCLSVSYNAPHAEDNSPEQYIWPPDLDSLYNDITIPGPVLGEEKYFEEQPEFVKEGLNRVRWHWRFDSPEKYQRMVKGHYRMISGIDRTIGWIREALKEKGVDDNTIIIFMGDNGYFMGERGFAGKWLMYENSLRVPLVIYDPRMKDHLTINKMALNIDIAPTILDYAGIPVPSEMQGKSLKKLIENEELPWRTDMFCEHLFDHKLIPQSEGYRTEKWKYFRYRHHPGHEFLYDLEDDSMEINNLAGDPQHEDILKTLREKTDQKIQQLEQARKH
jgi:arylsulfatase A-like enzyme